MKLRRSLVRQINRSFLVNAPASRRPGQSRNCPRALLEKNTPWPTTVYDRPRLVTVAWSKSRYDDQFIKSRTRHHR
jgi:hypothetical protein